MEIKNKYYLIKVVLLAQVLLIRLVQSSDPANLAASQVSSLITYPDSSLSKAPLGNNGDIFQELIIDKIRN
jgi:hypothetical protein